MGMIYGKTIIKTNDIKFYLESKGGFDTQVILEQFFIILDSIEYSNPLLVPSLSIFVRILISESIFRIV